MVSTKQLRIKFNGAARPQSKIFANTLKMIAVTGSFNKLTASMDVILGHVHMKKW
jgi:hypothetical protein